MTTQPINRFKYRSETYNIATASSLPDISRVQEFKLPLCVYVSVCVWPCRYSGQWGYSTGFILCSSFTACSYWTTACREPLYRICIQK